MLFTKTANLAIKGMVVEEKKRLCNKIGVTIDTLYRWLRTNDDSLTKRNVLKAISEETGIPIDDILEQDELVEDKDTE